MHIAIFCSFKLIVLAFDQMKKDIWPVEKVGLDKKKKIVLNTTNTK